MYSAKAVAYKRKWDKYNRNGGDMPERDIAMDTLRGVLATFQPAVFRAEHPWFR